MGAAAELGFLGAPGCLGGGTWIYIGGRSTSVEQRRAHEGGGRAQGGGRAPLPRAFLVASLTYAPSLLDCFHSKNNFAEGFIPFGLRLISLFFEILKQAIKQQYGLVPKVI